MNHVKHTKEKFIDKDTWMNKMKLEKERELPKSKAKEEERKQQFLSKSAIVCSWNQWLRKGIYIKKI